MVQNKLIFFYCLFVFIGLTYAIPRSAAAKYRRLAPSLAKREDCNEFEDLCGDVCCDIEYDDCIMSDGKPVCVDAP